MNKNASRQLFAAALAVLALGSCNDYESTAIDYEQTENAPHSTTATRPTLESAWQLKEVINSGQHNDNVFVYQDNLFNSLFTRTLGWNGGEVQSSVMVPGKGLAFVVRDGFYGSVDASTRARISGNEVRNGLVILTEEHGTLSQPSAEDLHSLNDFVQTDNSSAEDYYNGVPLMKPTNSTLHIWPGIANCYNGKLQMQFTTYRTSLGRRQATDIATYSISNPGQNGALTEEDIKTAFFTNLIAYDDCLWQDEDGHNYLYCSYLLTGISGVLVARTTTHDLTSPWEFCVTGTDGQMTWTPDMPTATATNASDEALRSNRLEDYGACQHPQVFKKGEWYYLVGQTYSNKLDVRIWRSKTPWGPFQDVKALCVLPGSVDKQGNKYYNELTRVVVHPALSRNGEIVISTAQTAPNKNDNYTYPGSADYVRPYFYRIYNWEQLFTE